MKRVNGFTLLELIFTTVILTTALTLGVPTLHQWIQRSKVTDFQYTILHSIRYARVQAILLQSTVTLCPGTNNCEDVWSKELLIFNDINSNGVRESDELLLKHLDIGALGQQLNWRSFRQKPYLQFNSMGLTRALNGTFNFCPNGTRESFKFAIILAKTGRTRVSNSPSCP